MLLVIGMKYPLIGIFHIKYEASVIGCMTVLNEKRGFNTMIKSSFRKYGPGVN
jgi:hypothetical protein